MRARSFKPSIDPRFPQTLARVTLGKISPPLAPHNPTTLATGRRSASTLVIRTQKKVWVIRVDRSDLLSSFFLSPESPYANSERRVAMCASMTGGRGTSDCCPSQVGVLCDRRLIAHKSTLLAATVQQPALNMIYITFAHCRHFGERSRQPRRDRSCLVHRGERAHHSRERTSPRRPSSQPPTDPPPPRRRHRRR